MNVQESQGVESLRVGNNNLFSKGKGVFPFLGISLPLEFVSSGFLLFTLFFILSILFKGAKLSKSSIVISLLLVTVASPTNLYSGPCCSPDKQAFLAVIAFS